MTYPRFLSMAQRRQLDRSRDVVALRREDDAINREQARRNAVTTKNTKAGPVERPPAVDDLDKPLDQLHEQIGSALAAVESARELNQKLDPKKAIDTNRFTAMKGGQ